MLSTAAFSCGSNDTPDDVTGNGESTSGSVDTEATRENTPDSLPADLNFNGETIRIAHRDGTVYVQEVTAEATGDIVDDAIYNRNRMVEERLNVKLESIPIDTDANKAATAVRTSIMSGSDDYDIASLSQYSILPHAIEGAYHNLDGNKYIDLSQPWWWSDYMDILKIGDNATFFLSGDIALAGIQNMSCIFFNKRLFEEMGVSADDIYQMVLDGDWTYDELSKYVAMGYKDLDGNTTADETDAYGMFVRANTEPDHFTYTAGNVMYTRDKDGIPSLNVNNEKFINYMSTLYDLYYNNVGTYVTKEETVMFNAFIEGRSLFLVNRFVGANQLRDMQDEYGIIPFPKYDKSQANYGALLHDCSTIYAIPVTVVNKLDAVSATLEAMCAQSYRTVVPAYYEMALKVKYTSDSTAGEIVDMIKEAATTDFVYAYNYAMNDAGLVCRKMMNAKSSDFASTWAGIESKAQQGLEDLIKAYTDLDV